MDDQGLEHSAILLLTLGEELAAEVFKHLSPKEVHRIGEAMTRIRTAALVGNPNSGKSALFNALTGARQKIANYPGVTVERKAGRMILPSGEPVELLDLPGAYSLDAILFGGL